MASTRKFFRVPGTHKKFFDMATKKMLKKAFHMPIKMFQIVLTAMPDPIHIPSYLYAIGLYYTRADEITKKSMCV
jgi:hypothetical protein